MTDNNTHFIKTIIDKMECKVEFGLRHPYPPTDPLAGEYLGRIVEFNEETGEFKMVLVKKDKP